MSSDNLEIVMSWHLRREVPSPEILLLTRNALWVKQANVRDMFN
jgi:hypothetical protein